MTKNQEWIVSQQYFGVTLADLDELAGLPVEEWPKLAPLNRLARLLKRDGPKKVCLWQRVRIGKPDECWPYFGPPGTRGYGMHLGWRAHRLAWALINDEDPEFYEVCHACDNPPCCNPRHLFLGTHEENILDAQRKGRMGKHGAKVKPALEMAAAGMKPMQIAAELGVNQNFVYQVLSNQSFKHHLARK